MKGRHLVFRVDIPSLGGIYATMQVAVPEPTNEAQEAAENALSATLGRRLFDVFSQVYNVDTVAIAAGVKESHE